MSALDTFSTEELMKKIQERGMKFDISGLELMAIFVVVMIYMGTGIAGIKTFIECDKVQTSQKWKNIKMFLSHTLTMALTLFFTLLFSKYIKSDGAFFCTVITLVGVIAGAMTVALTRECNDTADKSARNYGIASIVINIVLMFISIYFMMKKRGIKPRIPFAARGGRTSISSYRQYPATTST